MQRPKHHEHSYRSLAKTLSYRLIISVELFAVTYVLTGSFDSALQLTGWTAVISTVIYYLHERVWAHISWGRTNHKAGK
jgi:uncharacterized membrane protein